jgi:apolipoprotein N-acyltransferase
MHPLISLLATRPQLLADHGQAYAALVSEESGLAYAAWVRQVLLQAAALCFLAVTTALAGVAIMLWVTLSVPVNAAWALVAIPTSSLLIALLCLLLARQPAKYQPFTNLCRQFKADMAMLRATGLP